VRQLFKQRPFTALASLAGAAIAGLVGAVLVVGLLLSAPRRAMLGPPDGLNAAVRVGIPSASGSLLQGWWMPGQRGAGAVVLMHGVHGNRLGLVRRARLLADRGIAVLLFDFQAHGESEGRRITFGKLEALDAAAAVGYARDRAPGERVGALGISLGGAAALLGPAPLDVDALVLESVYPDIDTALANRLRAALGGIAGPVAAPVLAPLFKLLLPPILGVRPAELRPVDRIGEVRVPVLVAAGTADNRTTLPESQDLFAHVRAPGTFWPVPGAGHEDLQRFDPVGYEGVVLAFLDRHLRQAP
jgi:alpha-beta hydrolase superfamily lysophospholipase